ncbi:adenylate kinase [Cellulomonas sp.]|jgi:adenylate kinase|uniref:adenylate kinase n=1 Tax=Cellulomonas sp. TaxID=40001 RepID=UPI002D6E36C6|nr:adenylate kinase [Cellulomonas sp.]HYQ76547.1 adenylate kinase [Cellulomonas sp.]
MSTAPAASGSTARLVLLGPPGAGKGTQAARLAERLGVPAISTGDIFRANIKGGTELGRTAQEYTARGELVPDEVTNAMVRDRLAQPDAAQGFLLDGYPRNTAQVGELDAILEADGRALDAALEITADADVVVERLLKRAEIEGRADDTEPVIRRRLDVYAEQTAPVSGLYAERDLLVRVDGIGEVDEVTERLLAALASQVG